MVVGKPVRFAAFLKETAYQERKVQRFRSGDERVIAKNSGFILDNLEQRAPFAKEYRKTSALYYQGQPDFELLLDRIHQYLDMM